METKKLLYLIIEPQNKNYTTKHRFFNLILFTVALLFAGITIENITVSGIGEKTIVSVTGLIITLSFYYLSRFKELFNPMATVFFSLILFIFIPILWFENYGMKGMLPFFLILYIISIVFIFEGKLKKLFLLLSFTIAFVFSILDLLYYKSLNLCATNTNIYDINRNIAFLFVALSVAAFSSFAINRYKKEKQKAENLSKKDYLTGLYNRREGSERLSYLANYLSRNKRNLSLIMMDIDDFKKINDTYGHICGDNVLKAVSSTILSNIRRSDVAIRWGGEEFLIILPEITKERACIIAERIRREINSKIFKCKQTEFKITVTSGISSYRFEDNAEKNISAADEALYKGKQLGKNRTIVQE